MSRMCRITGHRNQGRIQDQINVDAFQISVINRGSQSVILVVFLNYLLTKKYAQENDVDAREYGSTPGYATGDA